MKEEGSKMMSLNPKTGKPIRILNTEASLWRNGKTLVWLKEGLPEGPRWDRWETVVVGPADFRRFSAKSRIDLIILPEDTQEARSWIQTPEAKKMKLIVATRQLVLGVGETTMKKLGLGGLICLEEVSHLFPFVGETWKGTAEDAVCLIAAILRMSYIYGASPEGRPLGALKETKKIPPECWLIQQYYRPQQARRKREIRHCLEKNLECSFFDKIVLLNEEDYSADYSKSESAKKIEQVVLGKRLSYADVLRFIEEKVPANVFVVFANSDIFFDSTLRDLWNVEMKDVFLSLLRYETSVDENPEQAKIFGPRADSQDAWALLSDSVKERQWSWADVEIPFGKAGCDNAITVELFRKKFLVVNPAFTVKAYHVHGSGVRNYDPADIVDKPMYLYCAPTGIHDMKPILDLRGFEVGEKMALASFDRPVGGSSEKALQTFCKMLERGERYKYGVGSQNTYRPKDGAQRFCRFADAFQTSAGLVYGYNELYIGGAEASKEQWSKSKMSSLTPSFRGKRSLAALLPAEALLSREKYMIQYLGKILVLWERFGGGEFWSKEEFTELLDCMRWGVAEVPVLPWGQDRQVWSEEVVSWMATDTKEITQEEVGALRRGWRAGWLERAEKAKRWVIAVDEKILTSEVAKRIEAELLEKDPEVETAVFFAGRTSVERIGEKMRGAAGLVVGSVAESWSWAWMLPEGSRLVEVQYAMDPKGEAVHFAGAAKLDHRMVVYQKALEEVQRASIVIGVCEEILSVGSAKQKVIEDESLPLLLMPSRPSNTFFGHAGDSFREMARLWAEKGYVRYRDDASITQIWLGGLGDILLYDRPTMEWQMTAPPEEQKYKMALFGNPAAPEGEEKVKSWFFWPRRPELVEELVVAGVSKKGWSERTKKVVFYGRIENRVQGRRRKQYDWSVACDEFIMPEGASAAYPFTQKQYLEKLAEARYGLCLAGYGKKCHREVECMAMGCVPVVVSEVDMENYAEPPQEGIHYLRVEKPEDIKPALEKISEENWQEMSVACREWWRRNASVEGSWALTKRLVGLV